MPKLDLSQVPTLEDVQLEKARRTLAEFVRQAWPIVEPGMELIWNWHIDAICEHLEAVSRGDVRNLLVLSVILLEFSGCAPVGQRAECGPPVETTIFVTESYRYGPARPRSTRLQA